MINKKDLRHLYKKKRASLSNYEIKERSDQIISKALKLLSDKYEVFHVFRTIERQKEIQTDSLIALLLRKSKTVCIPKTVWESGDLKHYQISEKTKFLTSRFGIPEPTEGIERRPSYIDLVFVPLLTFDKKGNRVGYGGGFYDRFLSKCRRDVVKVGLSLFPPFEQEIKVSPNDIALSICITPKEIYRF